MVYVIGDDLLFTEVFLKSNFDTEFWVISANIELVVVFFRIVVMLFKWGLGLKDNIGLRIIISLLGENGTNLM